MGKMISHQSRVKNELVNRGHQNIAYSPIIKAGFYEF